MIQLVIAMPHTIYDGDDTENTQQWSETNDSEVEKTSKLIQTVGSMTPLKAFARLFIGRFQAFHSLFVDVRWCSLMFMRFPRRSYTLDEY